MVERITWKQNVGLGRSGWTGIVGGRRLFSIELSASRRGQWVLQTQLPFAIKSPRDLSPESDRLKKLAEQILIVFMRSLFSAFVTDDLKASYAKAVEAHVGLYADVDDESVEDNGWRRGPGPLHLADFFADLSGTGILDVLKD